MLSYDQASPVTRETHAASLLQNREGHELGVSTS